MTLLEILLHELDHWPEGKEYVFQSTLYSEAIFASSNDTHWKTIQIASQRGPNYKVTREEWQTAKVKSLPFFHSVADILGEVRAVKELLAVGKINYEAKELDEAFAFADTPQGYDFWKDILEPSRGTHKLKHALNTIAAALHPEHYLQLQPDGSDSLRDHADNEVISFDNTDSLVGELLIPPPKFEHWDLLQDRFNWIAKDREGKWWAYDDKPVQSDDGWTPNGAFRSLGAMKIEIPCHWSRSLIQRPAHSEE